MLDLSTFSICNHCQNLQLKEYNFCSNCGKQSEWVQLKRENDKKEENSNLKFLSYYALLTVVLVFASGLLESSLWVLSAITILFAIADLIFASLQPKVFRLINFKNVKIPVLLTVVLVFIFSGLLVSLGITELNDWLFQENYYIMDDFVGLENPLFWAIVVYAVFPAFFEELAFRGFVFSNLDEIRGRKAAIIGSTFLFALVHLSLFSLLWIIPFALILSYLRVKHNTLIYGMVGHFTHNCTAVLLEYFGYI